MNLIKTILKSSKEIIITYIFAYVLIFISCLIYTLLGYQDLTSFINTYCLYISLIFYIIIILYLYKKNYKKEPTLRKNKYIALISLGISLAVFLNMIIFILIPPQPVETTLSPVLLLVSSGIVGPIYEEILFRYLLYNRLKQKYSIKKAITITTIIFALIHLSLVKIVYAFILGLIINISYEKNQNILAPILIHMSANSIVLLLNEYNTYVLLLSIISLVISIKINFPQNNWQLTRSIL